MSKKIGFTSILIVVFVIVLMAMAGTALASYDFTTHTVDHGMVSSSGHDLSAGGNPCESCHVPHGANGAYLWATPLHSDSGSTTGGTTGTVDTGYSSAIKPLCYSCHDGTETSVGQATAFSAGHYTHRTTANTAGSDCDRCHNPHDQSYGNFLLPEYRTRVYDEAGHVVKASNYGGTWHMVPYSADTTNEYNWSTNNAQGHTSADFPKTVRRWSPLIKGGDFCATCHESNMPSSHGSGASLIKRYVHPVYQKTGQYTDILTAGFPTALVPDGKVVWTSTMGLADLNYTDPANVLLTHVSSVTTNNVTPNPGANPTASIWPKAGNFDPSGTGDRDGTRLFNADGTKSSNLSTALLGTRSTTAYVMCESCHTPHGALDGVASGYHFLNTMDDTTFCGNCH